MPKPPKFTEEEIKQAMRVQAWTLISRAVKVDAMVVPFVTGVRAFATSQNDITIARYMIEAMFDEITSRFEEAKAALVAEFTVSPVSAVSGVPAELSDADRRDTPA